MSRLIETASVRNMTPLEADLLARRPPDDPLQALRADLEDACKEYGEFDLLVEILQNALDAIDEARYRRICGAAGVDPNLESSIRSWNEAVKQLLEKDYSDYQSRVVPFSLIKAGQYLDEVSDGNSRRISWWECLAQHLGGKPEELAEAADIPQEHPLQIIVRVDAPSWIEVVDFGTGISDPVAAFRHQSSSKRFTSTATKRIGIRGSHGWGLTAVLGWSSRVEVFTRDRAGDAGNAFSFSGYSSFRNGALERPSNEAITDLSEFDSRLVGDHELCGTHIRIQLASTESGNYLGHTLSHFSHQKMAKLLRLHTPIAQTNDFVNHPCFHNVRKDDFKILLTSIEGGNLEAKDLDYEILKISELNESISLDLDTFMEKGCPSNRSVKVIHRAKSGDHIYLFGAEVHPASLVKEIEESLSGIDQLPQWLNDEDKLVGGIPRGIRLSLSGGLQSEYEAVAPSHTNAGFRGTILSDTVRPTLGRRHVMDQRETIPKSAKRFVSTYEELRKRTAPKAEPASATPAAAKWRREQMENTREELLNQVPFSSSLRINCGQESREARTMLLFAEILSLGGFDNLRVLRSHLSEIYDFYFVVEYEFDNCGIEPSVMQERIDDGWAMREGSSFHRYAIGEFKSDAELILGDFNVNIQRKSPDTPDLLVSTGMDVGQVEQSGVWQVGEDPLKFEFVGQTHYWEPISPDAGRTRRLAVCVLETLIERMVQEGEIDAPLTEQVWNDQLPESYF